MLQPTTIVIKPAKMVMWLAKMVTEAANINGVFHQQNMLFFTQQNGLLNLAGWNHEGLGLWWKMGYQWGDMMASIVMGVSQKWMVYFMENPRKMM